VDDFEDDFSPSTNKSGNKKKRVNKHIKEAEAEGAYFWDVTKQYLFRPGVAGGLIGLGSSHSVVRDKQPLPL
jgi:hypothetical protein